MSIHHKYLKKITTNHDLALLMLSFALLLGCHSRQKKSALETSANHKIGQQVYQITLWQGGGFTGLTIGFTLYSSGEVAYWQRSGGQSDATLWIVNGYLAEVQKLKNQLEENGMLQVKYAETGNMTAGIKYETQGQQHVWTWNNSRVDNDLPESLREWYRNTMDFCRSTQPPK